MFVLVKTCAFTIYSLAVYIFAHYLTLSYYTSSLGDHLFGSSYENNSLYDFIIVGAGSAGATLAAQLCNGKCNVLLVEAGAPPAYFFDIPILAPLLQRSPYDWQYKTVPQEYACKGLLLNQSLWPQGKVLGGSSRLNYMAYVPGHPNDYNGWLPEFAEYGLKDDDPTINQPKWQTSLSDAVLNGLLEISPSLENDFGPVRLMTQNGQRWSTDKLLEDNLHNGLRVLTHSFVNKVILDRDYARGIEFNRGNNKFRAFARIGVVVSAGAIGSPKLLMLSGIGPKDHLQSLGIDVINDLPVGQNLVDHILTGIDLVTLNISSPLSLETLLNPVSVLNYTFFRKGPWTSAGIEGIGSFYTSSRKIKNESPALQLMLIPVGVSQDNGVVLRKSMGIPDDIFTKYFDPLSYRTAITIAPVLLHPKSSGEVKLASSNPLDDPIIDPKYLSNQEDVSTLIDGIKLVKTLTKTAAMKNIGASLYEAVFPGCEQFTFDSRDYWECYVRHLTLTSYHPAGTCKIDHVVDSDFRVLKMKNLFVVDASVLPELPSGNINAAVLMLAKKAGKLLSSREKRKRPDTREKCTKFMSYLIALYGADSDIFRTVTSS